MADEATQAKWDNFIAEMKQIKVGVKAWLILRKPTFELWAREGGEGITAYVIAILQGEAGRAKAMALNTGDDTTSKAGFGLGLVEREAFWIVVQGVLAGGKIPTWLIPIIGELIKQIQGAKT